MTSVPLGRALICVAILAVASGCGGGGGGGGSNDVVASGGSSPSVSSVTVTCDPSAVTRLETATCSALVSGSGDFDASVTWSADGGTIDPAGEFTAPDKAGSVTITATSAQDPSKNGRVLVRILYLRSNADRPDDVSGYQAHVMYVVPSDGADRQYDVNGQIHRSVERWNSWLAAQTNGRRIRLDTVDDELDVTFVRLDRTGEQMNAYGGALRAQLEYELVAKGFDAAEKLYLVYYDGGDVRTPACGMGSFPPIAPGTVAAMFMTALPSNFDCSSVFFAADIDDPGRQDHIGIHEVLHTLGFVPSCAPHQANGAHVGDNVLDQLYVGIDKAFPPLLDVNRDDYFEHDNPGCLDLADSAFLEPLPVTAEAPPGWPYAMLTAAPCADETQMRPRAGDNTAIEFINATSATVNVYLLDFAGVRQLVRSLPPNEGFVENTSTGYPYVVTTATNACIGIYLGATSFGRAVVR